MQLPDASRRHAPPRVACNDPPPDDGATPELALAVNVVIVAPQASTTPAPVAAELAEGAERAVDSRRCFTWFGDSNGDLPRISATVPDTMPVEKDVPDPLP
jgi:hypothetical protein